MSDRSKELAAAIKKLADDLGTNTRVVGAWRRHALIQPKDRAKEKWLRTVLAFPWEGRDEVALLAWWIADLMDWDKGRLGSCNSIRDLEAVTGIPRATVQRHLAKLIANGFLAAPTRAAKQRGAFLVPEATQALEVGQCRTEHLSEKYLNIVNHLTSGPPTSQIAENGSGSPMGQICDDLAHPRDSLAHPWATYPSLPSPVNEVPCQQGSGSSSDVDQTPTTEGSLTTPTHQLPRPALDSNRAPRPPVASATVKTHVALATSDGASVAHANHGYGYGTPIVGLNEHTKDIVDRVVAMQAGIITNKDPAWIATNEAVRETSPRRVRAAILDLEATHAAKKLRSPVLRALRGFAAALTEDAAVAKLEEATKPRISAAEMFGWRS